MKAALFHMNPSMREKVSHHSIGCTCLSEEDREEKAKKKKKKRLPDYPLITKEENPKP